MEAASSSHEDTVMASNPDEGWRTATSRKRHQQRLSIRPQTAVPDHKPVKRYRIRPHVPDNNSGKRYNWLPRGPSTSDVKHQQQRPPLPSSTTVPGNGRPEAVPSIQPKALESRGAPESDTDDKDDGVVDVPIRENKEQESTKEVKQKKVKKTKITIDVAASRIDAAVLAAYLEEISASYETQQDIQLMRFADFFGLALSSVSDSQFPLIKTFMESPITKMVVTPLCYISGPVYKTSFDWIAKRSPEALADFVMWCLDGIFDDLSTQQSSVKESKKPIQQIPVGKTVFPLFLVAAMVLRRKPTIMIELLPKLKDPKYQGEKKLGIIIWAIAQVYQGDLVVGMYCCINYLIPEVLGNSSINPESRDLVLQLAEIILSMPKSWNLLLNAAVRKRGRLVPPSVFDLLMRAAFPAPAARNTDSERFEAIYPILKELALAGSPGTETTKEASEQLLPCVVKAMDGNNEDLTKEATDALMWCLAQNPECYQQLEKLEPENPTVRFVLQRLGNQHSREEKNEEARSTKDAGRSSYLRAENKEEARSTRDAGMSSCMKSGVIVALAIAVGFYVFSL